MKDGKKIAFIFARYIIVLLVAFPNLFLFYLVFSPLTIYPSSSILSLFYETSVHGNTILVNSVPVELVNACIAGSAFYLLFLLNLSVPLNFKKRIFSLVFSFFLFLVINILRISIFSSLYINNFKYFSITHLAFWYVLSGIFVFLVWLITIRTFKIKAIPFYSDIKFIHSRIK